MSLIMDQPALVKTNTDEFYFPSRLIYRIESTQAVLGKLKKLKCAYKHPTEDRWFIECSHEALKFGQWNDLYSQALKKNDPIVIAYIRFPGRSQMHVYIRSFTRVVPVLKLLDKFLPRTLAMGTHHEVCFKLITANNKHEIPTPDEIFSAESNIYYSKNMMEVDRLEEETRTTGKDNSRQIDALFASEFQESSKGKSLIRDIERKRLEVFYTDGADDYSSAMMVQETLALARHTAGGTLNPLKFIENILMNPKTTKMPFTKQ